VSLTLDVTSAELADASEHVLESLAEQLGVSPDRLSLESMTETDDGLHPLQEKFIENGAIQCGFCTSGMLLSAKTLLDKNAKPDELEMMVNPDESLTPEFLDALYEEFDLYLIHGGFLTAMNDLAKHNRILPATFTTYSDWIRGDALKRGKQDHYLREILQAIVKRYGSQITWNSLAKDLSIDHPKTVSEYVELLAAMDAVFVQPALIEDKLTAAPKKARKLMFTDPFIFHAVRSWLMPVEDPYNQQVLPAIHDPEWTGRLVEASLVTHYRCNYPTFYIKAEGEVDVAYIDQNRFWPVEVKWTGQIRPKDLKQIAKYSNGRILTKSRQPGHIMGIPTEPLPIAMLRLGAQMSMR